MIFNEPIFLVFFVVFYALYLLIGSRHRWHLRLITVSSLIFYAAWNWRYVPLLVGTGLIDFWCARKISDEQARGLTGKRWLVASMVSNLAVLGFFKYTNFFLESAKTSASWFGWDLDVPHLDVILPLGISFYTFQSMSYTIDVYMETTHARRSPLPFLSALSFFPHLVAGPIVRGSSLVPQFERGPVVSRVRIETGLLLIAMGLFKKAVADLVGPIATAYFGQASGDDLVGAWTGVLAFGVQIYGDFAGYSDIAIGLGLMVGYDFPQNFDLPYLSASPAEYWRRWHMSLSTWLRDYLFVPLWRALPGGGTFLPLLLTMTLAGLWHGAGWTFVVYGVYMGLLIHVTTQIGRRWSMLEEQRTSRGKSLPRLRFIGVMFTFYSIVILGGALFRASSLERWTAIVGELHTGAVKTPTWDAFVDLVLVVVALVASHGMDWLHLRKRDALIRPYILLPLVFVLFMFSFMLGTGHEFIYFAF